jgi:hypothetical protein
MDRKNRRRARRLFATRPRRGGGDGSLRFANVFSSEYRPFTIIEPASRSNWQATPLLMLGALIVLGAALIFLFSQ